MTWRPILEGEAKAQALDAIKAIAAELVAREPAHPGNLAGGGCGEAILFAYLAQAGLGEFTPAEERLGKAVDAVAEIPMRPDLYAGFTGVAWTTEHLQGPSAEGEEDANEAIDEALLEHVSITPWIFDYDLIIGLVGFGVYALERIQRPSARKVLSAVIDRLHETAVPMEHGVSWLTGPHLMIPETAKDNPEGYFNAGLAHGVPGVIALLGAAIEAGVNVERAQPLFDGAVAWLLSLRQRAHDGSEFPYTIPKHQLGEKRDLHGCRAAWCYGDPGIVAGLLWAARATQNAELEKVALDITKGLIARAPETVGAVDAGVCHGSAGLALIYNRMWQATRDPALLEAARAWTARTLAQRKPGTGLCGYQSWGPVPGEAFGKLGWADDPSLLTGVAGIALTLLAAVTDQEPKWDRMLLTSVPPID